MWYFFIGVSIGVGLYQEWYWYVAVLVFCVIGEMYATHKINKNH